MGLQTRVIFPAGENLLRVNTEDIKTLVDIALVFLPSLQNLFLTASRGSDSYFKLIKLAVSNGLFFFITKVPSKKMSALIRSTSFYSHMVVIYP